MSMQNFINQAVSPWMQSDGPDSEIVLSSRIRFARNLKNRVFPIIASDEQSKETLNTVKKAVQGESYNSLGKFEWLEMSDLTPLEKRVLVEKHLISPGLAEDSTHGAALINESESVSIMVNEEDHLTASMSISRISTQ